MIYPDSILADSVYIPNYLSSTIEEYYLSDFNIELDQNGTNSIINLQDEKSNKMPFIDMAQFDPDTNDWLWFKDSVIYVYKSNGLVFKYCNPSDKDRQEAIITPPIEYSFNALYNAQSAQFTYTTWPNDAVSGTNVDYFKFSPIVVTYYNKPFIDVTDYLLMSKKQELTTINTVSTKEFYYDFDGRIHMNQELQSLNPNEVKVYINRIKDQDFTIKCILNTNTTANSETTPVIDDYIVYINGQNLS